MRISNFIWGIGCALLAGNMSRAAVVYTYTADQSTYLANVNSTVTVDLYLQETLTGGSSSYITSNGGLIGAGIAVLRETTLTSHPACVTNFSFNTAEFGESDSTDESLTATGVEFSEDVSLPNGFVNLGNTDGGVAVGYSNRIYLGRVFILTGAAPNQSTNFEVNLDDAQGPGLTLTATLNDLDVTDPGLYTGVEDAGYTEFTVTTISTPEPASLSLAGFALGGLLCRRPRRR